MNETLMENIVIIQLLIGMYKRFHGNNYYSKLHISNIFAIVSTPFGFVMFATVTWLQSMHLMATVDQIYSFE